MADRLIKVLEQGKLIHRGMKARGKDIIASQDTNETLNYTIDWSGWLGSDTIASVSNVVTGVTLTGASNTTTTATFKLSSTASGWVEHRITTAAGLVKELMLFLQVDGYPISQDYGVTWQVL